MASVEEHRKVQEIAKSVLAELASSIVPEDTERSIAIRSQAIMARHGITQTWYYDCPALVLLGSRSCLSVSGRSYQPSLEPVGEFNLITVDLSPTRKGVWGDCARSFYVEEGRVVPSPQSKEYKNGEVALTHLHERMQMFAAPETTCEELFQFGNHLITSMGFRNLDFLGNVGHSIESDITRRRYIESGNQDRLSDLGLFTFEPHICESGLAWGFKHENIYYFGPCGRLEELQESK